MTAGIVDLHLHTTASDGLCTPAALVERAWSAGLRTMSVTDHDTVAGLAEAERAAAAAGMRFVPGIEITAVEHGRDVHVLGYFFDREHPALVEFLKEQRRDRMRRLTAMADLLESMGKPIDRAALVPQGADASPGRPHLARALVQAGHVGSVREAFETLIGEGGIGWIPRAASPPSHVIRMIQRAGGIASLAHPGLLRRDDLIPPMIDAGLAAIEAFHSEHDQETTLRYVDLAERHGVLVSGGSDYHGAGHGRREAAFGSVGLPAGLFERLASRASGGRQWQPHC